MNIKNLETISKKRLLNKFGLEMCNIKMYHYAESGCSNFKIFL